MTGFVSSLKIHILATKGEKKKDKEKSTDDKTVSIIL